MHGINTLSYQDVQLNYLCMYRRNDPFTGKLLESPPNPFQRTHAHFQTFALASSSNEELSTHNE